MNPEDLASQSVKLKEEQLRREEEKLREIELKVQREINEKRQELLARESQLKEMYVTPLACRKIAPLTCHAQ
jgi:septin family protein